MHSPPCSFVLGFALLEKSRSTHSSGERTLPGAEFKLDPSTAAALERRTSDDAFEFGIHNIVRMLQDAAT